MRIIYFITLLLLFTTSCIDTTKVAPKVHTLLAGTDLPMLQHGRDLYITKCSKCHNTLRITRYTASQWLDILPEMSDKSKLTTAESTAVSSYIDAVLLSATARSNQPSHGE